MGGEEEFTAETASGHDPLDTRVSAADVSRVNGTDPLRWTTMAAHLCGLLPEPATQALTSKHQTPPSRGRDAQQVPDQSSKLSGQNQQNLRHGPAQGAKGTGG